jgi:hypothetical protein
MPVLQAGLDLDIAPTAASRYESDSKVCPNFQDRAG